jgi:hypothetical protein
MPAPNIVSGQAVFNFTDASSQSSLSAPAFTAAITSGNAVGGIVKYGTATSVFNNITDDKGNTYTVIATYSIGNNTYKLFALGNITNGPKTLTLNFTTTNGVFPRIACYEVAGSGSGGSMINVFDGNGQVTPGTGTDAITSQSGSTSTSVANCLLVGHGWNYTNIGGSATNFLIDGTGETGVENLVTAPNYFDMGRITVKTLASAGTAANTFTAANPSGTVDSFATFMLAFAPPGAATATTQSHGFVSS